MSRDGLTLGSLEDLEDVDQNLLLKLKRIWNRVNLKPCYYFYCYLFSFLDSFCQLLCYTPSVDKFASYYYPLQQWPKPIAGDFPFYYNITNKVYVMGISNFCSWGKARCTSYHLDYHIYHNKLICVEKSSQYFLVLQQDILYK